MSKLDTLYNEYGQSPWIDNIRRDWLNDGTLASLVEQGVRGVTSNPSIFAKALATSSAYDGYLDGAESKDPERLFETLAVADVRDACDVLSSVHSDSKREFAEGVRRYCDGFVSLEVSPRLARDTAGTVQAAKRLAAEVGRELMTRALPSASEVRTTEGAWLNFRRRRTIQEPELRAFGLEVRFDDPVEGPLALGALSHFGLGLFRPIP